MTSWHWIKITLSEFSTAVQVWEKGNAKVGIKPIQLDLQNVLFFTWDREIFLLSLVDFSHLPLYSARLKTAYREKEILLEPHIVAGNSMHFLQPHCIFAVAVRNPLQVWFRLSKDVELNSHPGWLWGFQRPVISRIYAVYFPLPGVMAWLKTIWWIHLCRKASWHIMGQAR